jgi:hypothetical protein
MPAPRPLNRKALRGLALRWALSQGFKVAATGVALPSLKTRVDVAACKPEAPKRVKGKLALRAGATLLIECFHGKPRTSDELPEESALARLAELEQQRAVYEEAMRRSFPTLREGETLFPEFDVYRFQDVGSAEYAALLKEIELLSLQVHHGTRFGKLGRWPAANLRYVAAECGAVHLKELPAGWGLLERHGAELVPAVKAVWFDASEINRWTLMMRIAMRATQSAAESSTDMR